MKFEWDHDKARSNWKKHRVSFEEAKTVFFSPLAQYDDDPDHSFTEHREILIGESSLGRVLMLSFTEVSPGLIRIISARRATNTERGDYEQLK